MGLTEPLTAEVIIWNKTENTWCSVHNFIILVTKFYIYRCKVQGIYPMLTGLIKELDMWYCIEKYNAGNKQKHDKKWSPVLECLK